MSLAQFILLGTAVVAVVMLTLVLIFAENPPAVMGTILFGSVAFVLVVGYGSFVIPTQPVTATQVVDTYTRSQDGAVWISDRTSDAKSNINVKDTQKSNDGSEYIEKIRYYTGNVYYDSYIQYVPEER